MAHLIDKEALVAEIKHHLQFTPEHTNAFIEGEEHAYRTILSFIDSLQEEPKECMYALDDYTDEDRKVLCDGCDEECKFNKKEESASEDLEQAIDTYLATYFGGEKEKQEWPFLKKMAIHFANWQKQHELRGYVKQDDYVAIQKVCYDNGYNKCKEEMIEKFYDWLRNNATYIHPRKGTEECITTLGKLKQAMKDE